MQRFANLINSYCIHNKIKCLTLENVSFKEINKVILNFAEVHQSVLSTNSRMFLKELLYHLQCIISSKSGKIKGQGQKSILGAHDLWSAAQTSGSTALKTSIIQTWKSLHWLRNTSRNHCLFVPSTNVG